MTLKAAGAFLFTSGDAQIRVYTVGGAWGCYGASIVAHGRLFLIGQLRLQSRSGYQPWMAAADALSVAEARGFPTGAKLNRQRGTWALDEEGERPAMTDPTVEIVGARWEGIDAGADRATLALEALVGIFSSLDARDAQERAERAKQERAERAKQERAACDAQPAAQDSLAQGATPPFDPEALDAMLRRAEVCEARCFSCTHVVPALVTELRRLYAGASR